MARSLSGSDGSDGFSGSDVYSEVDDGSCSAPGSVSSISEGAILRTCRELTLDTLLRFFGIYITL
jgi:hypothetical protein